MLFIFKCALDLSVCLLMGFQVVCVCFVECVCCVCLSICVFVLFMCLCVVLEFSLLCLKIVLATLLRVGLGSRFCLNNNTKLTCFCFDVFVMLLFVLVLCFYYI